jgi:hypothetical protein
MAHTTDVIWLVIFPFFCVRAVDHASFVVLVPALVLVSHGFGAFIAQWTTLR